MLRPRLAVSPVTLPFFALIAGIGAACSGCASQPKTAEPTPPAASAVPTALSEADARHLLGRLTFGPRPGDAAALQAEGTTAWLERQLTARADDPGAPYAAAFGTPLEISTAYAKRDASADGADGAAIAKKLGKLNVGRLLRDLGEGELLRAAFSEAQLQEVLTSFFTDHFNVFARKGQVRFFAGDFVLRTIRPRVFGRFEDLLRATAEHPAMLAYLDNASSSARRGINENYARELLELHTLGVDGGYTQADVEGAAKILSGWGLANLKKDPSAAPFVFRAKHHVGGSKTVLGVTYEPGGKAEGDALLVALARHPSTARHLATKLCRRFVADEAPHDCVNALTAAYTRSDGTIAEMMRALISHPSLWRPEVRGAKTKQPKELLVSALRALGARPAKKPGLARALARLGQPVLGQAAPTGWPDAEGRWVSASAALSRMDLALRLAEGRLTGVKVDLDAGLGEAEPDVDWAAEVDARLLGGAASEPTRAALRAAVEAQRPPARKRAVAIAVGLASPEFSRR